MQTTGAITSAALDLFGVRLVGFTAESGRKVLLSAGLVIGIIVLAKLLHWAASLAATGERSHRAVFWTRQAIALTLAAVSIFGALAIWFNDPTRLTTVLGWFAAGLAVALQRVITAIAAYFVILRGRTFTAGDRIAMAGVRGDVVALGFVQTTIMEMGQPPGVQTDAPAMWVRARQYSGRLVTVTNDKIFDHPVYNYSREFPLIWEEMSIPVSYRADRDRAEAILAEVAQRHTIALSSLGEEKLRQLEARYFVRRSELEPRVFYRLTDNWLELTARFIAEEAGTRGLKDRMSRDILAGLEAAGIDIASATYDVVGMPPITVRLAPEAGRKTAAD
ncbi:MAG: mechanosensitive ion channel family protein [Thiohalocapsa sp.]